MSTNLGIPGVSAPPPADRATTPGWRDPRLWIGVAIVAASVLLGARVLAAADDTVAVWVVSDDLGAGSGVSTQDLEVRRVRFAESAAADRYLLASESVPAETRLTRAVGAGELLPRSALGTVEQADAVEVPVAVEDGQVPRSVQAGSIVSVYLIAPSGTSGEDPPSAGPVLSEVPVLDAPPVEETFGGSGKRQIVLAVPQEQVDDFFATLSGADTATVAVVRAG